MYIFIQMAHIILKKLLEEINSADFVETVVREKCPVSYWAIRTLDRKAYRGTDGQVARVRYDPAEGRTAKETNNFSLYYADSLESWAEIPERSKSVMFTNGYKNAEPYGRVRYIVFEGDPIVAHGATSDNYQNYTRGVEKATGIPGHKIGVQEIDRIMDGIMSYLHTYHPEKFGEYDSTWLRHRRDPSEVRAFVQTLDENLGIIDKAHFIDNVQDVYKSEFFKSTTLLDFFEPAYSQGFISTLDVIYDPEVNGIKTAPLREIVASDIFTGKAIEFWTGAPYYLI